MNRSDVTFLKSGAICFGQFRFRPWPLLDTIIPGDNVVVVVDVDVVVVVVVVDADVVVDVDDDVVVAVDDVDVDVVVVVVVVVVVIFMMMEAVKQDRTNVLKIRATLIFEKKILAYSTTIKLDLIQAAKHSIFK